MRTDAEKLSDHRYALEVLDQLTGCAMNLGEVSQALRRPKGVIGAALRSLIIGGLVTADVAGSWDDCRADGVPSRVRYRHTARGRVLVERLSNLDGWEFP